MDEIVIVNCSTGEVIQRGMTAEEVMQRQADDETHQKLQQVNEDEQAARHDTLSKVAEVAGVSADELKSALRI